MLSLCIIVKNEEKNLPVLFNSIVDHVDQVVVTDTGSTDNTKKVCEEMCGDKLKWSEFEWCDDFAAARNFNFSQADGDWLVWADADDTLVGAENLKETVSLCEENNINSAMFPYHYLVDENGNVKCIQARERLIKNNGLYKWIGRLHEAMLPVSKLAKSIKLSNTVWVHRATEKEIEDIEWIKKKEPPFL